jgi:hypothetical protein
MKRRAAAMQRKRHKIAPYGGTRLIRSQCSAAIRMTFV